MKTELELIEEIGNEFENALDALVAKTLSKATARLDGRPIIGNPNHPLLESIRESFRSYLIK